MEQDKIRISNWFTNPKEFKKLVSYSIDWKKYPEYFCSIKNGVRSNIRNIVKVASRLDWNQENLKTICNNPNISTYKSSGEGSFKDGYPDTSWGYTGPEMPTTKSILERIKESYVLPNN